MHLLTVSEQPCCSGGRATYCDWPCEQRLCCIWYCTSYILSLLFSSCVLTPNLNSSPLSPDVKTSPSRAYISLLNLSVGAKTLSDVSHRHCTLKLCTKALQEIYLLGGTTWLFSCKCLFLWDSEGFTGMNHCSLSHNTGDAFSFFFDKICVGFSLGH